MKTTFIIITNCLLCYASLAQSARNLTDINNKTISVDSLNGKKLLIVVLPSQKDTAIINQLIRFQSRFGQKINIVGLVSTQAGSSTVESFRNTYDNVTEAGITVTEGLGTIDTAARGYESVIKWLTDKSNNRQNDHLATGSKYFLSEDGRLYAQLGKDISLDDRIVQNIVNTVVPRAVFRSPQKVTTGTDAVKDSTQSHF